MITRRSGPIEVHSVFSTLQGEGPFAGRPAVFVRLYGCNFTCPGCDTEYLLQREEFAPEALADKVLTMRGPASLAVLTGGEPLRQPVWGLTDLLRVGGMAVQIETNGSCCPDGAAEMIGDCVVVCSPKTPSIHPELEPLVGHYKYVMRHDSVMFDGLPARALGMPLPPWRPPRGFPRDRVWLQPEDSGDPSENALNLAACVESCLRHGWRLCLQTHKTAGVP
jgi:7-carboxy-7-deazaguanine synthase